MVRRHRVLTTDHVCDLFFDNINTAQHRLSILYRLRLLERFNVLLSRYRTSPYHYVLDQLGAMLLAAEDERDLDKLHWNTDMALSVGKSQRLAHIVGTNGFFTALARTARQRPGCELAEWWSERLCKDQWGRVVRPDGYGVWVEHGRRLPFLLEYDRGTETLERLAGKLEGYTTLAQAAGHPTLVLFSFPTPQREAHARHGLAHPIVPVATSARSEGGSPSGAIWRPVGGDGGKRRLIDLANAVAERGQALREDPTSTWF